MYLFIFQLFYSFCVLCVQQNQPFDFGQKKNRPTIWFGLIWPFVSFVCVISWFTVSKLVFSFRKARKTQYEIVLAQCAKCFYISWAEFRGHSIAIGFNNSWRILLLLVASESEKKIKSTGYKLFRLREVSSFFRQVLIKQHFLFSRMKLLISTLLYFYHGRC